MERTLMPSAHLIILGSLALFVVTAAIYDFRFRRIPNWLNLSGVVLGFGLNALFFHAHGALAASEGMVLATAAYLPLYLLRGMGAGDVKLMAAVGALIGPANWFVTFVATALVGGAAAAAYACLKGRFTETCCNVCFLLKDLAHFRMPHRTNPQMDFRNKASLSMPHAVLIALGSIAFIANAWLRLF